jgi:hypothetical protein
MSRSEIRFSNHYPPSPSVNNLILENQELKAKSNLLYYLVIGGVVVSLICLVAYLKAKEENAKLKIRIKENTE